MRFYNPGRHDQYQGTELGVDSVLCMPIMDLEDNVMGVVELINKEGMIFCSYEINFFCSMFCFSSADGRGRATSNRLYLFHILGVLRFQFKTITFQSISHRVV